MKDKLESLRYNRAKEKYHVVNNIESGIIYIADFSNSANGPISISELKPSINSVILDNNSSCLNIYYDAFEDHAFKKPCGTSYQQCECVLFPSSMEEDDWILFVETKYCKNESAALDISRARGDGYPSKAIEQIKETVLIFRSNSIISSDKCAKGLISFPELPGPFGDCYWAVGDAQLLKNCKCNVV